MNKQEYLLVILSEECAEVIQEVSKVLRFGPNGSHPKYIGTNKERLNNEIGDLIGIISMLRDEGIVEENFEKKVLSKMSKVEKYLKYSKSIGILTE